VRNFLGFPSLKEVECSGATLPSEVKVLSLTLFTIPSNEPLALMDTYVETTCKTFSEYASCSVDAGDSRKSFVRTLLADLEEEGRVYVGCNVSMRVASGHTLTYPSQTWRISVYRESKLKQSYLYVIESAVVHLSFN
jgi:hypothetical protein